MVEGDQGFESPFLQRRVNDEPVPRHPARGGHARKYRDNLPPIPFDRGVGPGAKPSSTASQETRGVLAHRPPIASVPIKDKPMKLCRCVSLFGGVQLSIGARDSVAAHRTFEPEIFAQCRALILSAE